MKFSDVTPNLVVAEVERSLAFYRDVLGFSVTATVPEASPFAFAMMQRDDVTVFLNSLESVKEYPSLATRPIGGTNTLYMVVEAEEAAMGVDRRALRAGISPRAVIMPTQDQFYGMREFGIEDPDGYIIYAAQRIAG